MLLFIQVFKVKSPKGGVVLYQIPFGRRLSPIATESATVNVPPPAESETSRETHID